ncbi:hypothetical protein [Leucobacter luti]|uniref:hypothetical protein n=1 Tax=Leucobacter luti TaxID=340320 RepID=UPI003D0369B8
MRHHQRTGHGRDGPGEPSNAPSPVEFPGREGGPSPSAHPAPATPIPAPLVAPTQTPIEPPVDTDSVSLLATEQHDKPHEATRFDAGTGQGTVHEFPRGAKAQERPILDGSTESRAAEASTPNPNRGEADPALVTHQPALTSANSMRWITSALVAAVVLITALLILAQWDPVWSGVGVTVVFIGLLAMHAVRLTRFGQRARLRIDAALMAIICLVPIAIIVTAVLSYANRVWS